MTVATGLPLAVGLFYDSTVTSMTPDSANLGVTSFQQQHKCISLLGIPHTLVLPMKWAKKEARLVNTPEVEGDLHVLLEGPQW